MNTIKNLLLVFLSFQLAFSKADGTQCKNGTNSKLQEIVESSMENVLQTFFLDSYKTFFSQENTPTFKQCPQGWFRILDSCLYIPSVNEKANATEAIERCQELVSDSRLFEPRYKMANDLVRRFVDILDAGKPFSDGIWIGVNDVDREGHYVYDSTMTQVHFTNWRSGQPDGENDDCTCFDEDSEGQWRDYGCDNEFRFICEIV